MRSLPAWCPREGCSRDSEQMRQYEAVEPRSSTGARARSLPISWSGLATGAKSPWARAPRSLGPPRPEWIGHPQTTEGNLLVTHKEGSVADPRRLQPLQPGNPP